ncbi:hypothetical protein [Streptomyces roseolus]|uniref:hypothetical protein n=1 Tax=Streptomyces roseolus TaxID=67358 RepID=UPI0037A388F3
MHQVINYAELGVVLAALRVKRNSPGYRLMEERADDTKRQFGRLPHTTAWRIATRLTRPSLHQMRAFLIGCGVPPHRHSVYMAAWKRADAQHRRENAGELPGAASDDVRLRDPYTLARHLGCHPLENFRGYHRPWSVCCRFCQDNIQRIRLDKEVARLHHDGARTCQNCGRISWAPAT